MIFFFNDTATTEIYTLSLHDALPICRWLCDRACCARSRCWRASTAPPVRSSGPCTGDRKSTRLNSSHQIISYAVFCLKKKKQHETDLHRLHRDVATDQADLECVADRS